MKKGGMEGIRGRLVTSVVVALMLLLSMSMMALGANQLHWGFGDGEDLPTGEDRGVSYFVDSARPDDTGNGLTWATAKKTIQAAINTASSGNGDYIYIKAGNYDAVTSVTKSNIHIFGEGAKLTSVREFEIEASNVEISGFTLGGVDNVGIDIRTSVSNIDVHENIFDAPIGIVVSVVTAIIVTSLQVHQNYFETSQGGIYCWNALTESSIYDNSFVYGSYGYGIKFTNDYTTHHDNFIYDNRFTGSGTQNTVGIDLGQSTNNNVISGNQFGGNDVPINDYGSGNIWLNNHWDDWTGSFTLTRAHGTTPQTVMSNVDIPSEGKVTVRFTFDPTDVDIPGNAIITARMLHPTYTTVLLAPSGQWDNTATDKVFPTVEATLDGGNNQMSVTIQTDTRLLNTGDSQLDMTYEILDA